MSGGVEIKGADELFKALEEASKSKDIEKTVENNATDLERTMKRSAKFKGHYDSSGNFVKPTGATRESIKVEMNSDGTEGKVAPSTDYAHYLEYGTRRMGAQPFVRPSLEEQARKFKKDMEKLVK